MKYFRFIIVSTIVITLSLFVLCETLPQTVVRDDTGDCWVYDFATRSLLKISSDDGSILFQIYGFNELVAIEIDPTTGELWALDRGDKVLILIRKEGEIRKRFYGFTDPTLMKVVRDTGEVWIVDNDELVKVSQDGEFLKRVSGFSDIRDFDIAYTYDGNLWVAEPQKVSYITQDGEVIYTYEGSEEGGPLEDVIDIETERDSQTCWIADHHAAGRDHIILISATQEGEIRHDYSEEGYDDILMMEYNFSDFSIWAIFGVDDTNEGKPVVVRLDMAGEKVWDITELPSPVSVAVDTESSRLFGWIGDDGSGRVFQVYPFSGFSLVVKGISEPSLLAVVNRNY